MTMLRAAVFVGLLLAVPAAAADFRCVNLAVYDADTVHCTVMLGFRVGLVGESVRIVGVQAPELRTPEGQAARDALITKMAGRTEAILRSAGMGVRDKYGRVLGDIIVDGESIAEWLLKHGHAVPYK